MTQINSKKEEMYVNFVDSQIIDDLYIIPGMNGREVNINRTYSNMQEERVFNEKNIIFDQIKPEVSLEDNKDKIIIRGNELKNSVSLLFESNGELAKYMHQNNYVVDLLISREEYDFNYELINHAKSRDTYMNIDKYLSKAKRNKNLCVTFNDEIPEICEGKYVVKPTLTITHANLSSEKSKIASGEIIVIKDSLTLAELNIVLNQIKYHDLKVVALSELIQETYNKEE